MIAFIALTALWIALEAALTAPDQPERGTLALPTGLVLLAGNVAGLVEHGDGLAVGALVMAAGIALRVWAIVTLGAGFRTALTAARRVTTGPYRWLAHPSELGLVLAAAGGALLLDSVASAASVVLLVPLALVRSRREAQRLPA